jgi:hypothetical protein
MDCGICPGGYELQQMKQPNQKSNNIVKEIQ